MVNPLESATWIIRPPGRANETPFIMVNERIRAGTLASMTIGRFVVEIGEAGGTEGGGTVVLVGSVGGIVVVVVVVVLVVVVVVVGVGGRGGGEGCVGGGIDDTGGCMDDTDGDAVVTINGGEGVVRVGCSGRVDSTKP